MPYTNSKDRYSVGYNKISHRGKSIPTVVGNRKYTSLINNLPKLPREIGYVPAGYAHRPDLISNIFYGTPAYWWLILEANNIDDPFEGLNVNDRIIIPKI